MPVPLATIFSLGGLTLLLPLASSIFSLIPHTGDFGQAAGHPEAKTAPVLNQSAHNDAPSQPPAEETITREAEHAGLMKPWLALCKSSVRSHCDLMGVHQWQKVVLTFLNPDDTITKQSVYNQDLSSNLGNVSGWNSYNFQSFLTQINHFSLLTSQWEDRPKKTFCVVIKTEFILTKNDHILWLNYWRVAGDDVKTCDWRLEDCWRSSQRCWCRNAAHCGRRKDLHL